MTDQRQRRKVAAWHTLYELGQAREALRRMGEDLGEPPARSREAFADAVYNLTGPGQAEPGRTGRFAISARQPPALHLLRGGEDAPSAGGTVEKRDDRRGVAYGDRPPTVPAMERSGHPTPTNHKQED